MPAILRDEGGQLQPAITAHRDSPPDDRSHPILSRVQMRPVITKPLLDGSLADGFNMLYIRISLPLVFARLRGAGYWL
jgi:hypothetical protein